MTKVIRGSYFQRNEDGIRRFYEESDDSFWGSMYFYEGHYYVSILDEFVKTGQIPDEADPWNDDYLEHYLREVMGDPFVAYSVLGMR